MRSCRKYGVSFNSNMDVPTLLAQWLKVPIAMVQEFVDIAKDNKNLLQATSPQLYAIFNQLASQYPQILIPPVPIVPSPAIPKSAEIKLREMELLLTTNVSLVASYILYLNTPTLPPVNLVIKETIDANLFGGINTAMLAINIAKTATSIAFEAEVIAKTALNTADEAVIDGAAVLTGQVQLVAAKLADEAAKLAVTLEVDALEAARTALYTLIENS